MSHDYDIVLFTGLNKKQSSSEIIKFEIPEVWGEPHKFNILFLSILNYF